MELRHEYFFQQGEPVTLQVRKACSVTDCGRCHPEEAHACTAYPWRTARLRVVADDGDGCGDGYRTCGRRQDVRSVPPREAGRYRRRAGEGICSVKDAGG